MLLAVGNVVPELGVPLHEVAARLERTGRIGGGTQPRLLLLAAPAALAEGGPLLSLRLPLGGVLSRSGTGHRRPFLLTPRRGKVARLPFR